jgi:hypothetical protein
MILKPRAASGDDADSPLPAYVQKSTVFSEHRQDWLAAVRIDHTALVTATAGDVISVPPKRSELGAVSPDDKN